MKIDVMVACGRNSLPYTQFMIDTIQHTADKDTKFRFLLGINDTPEYLNMAKHISSKYDIAIIDCITRGEYSLGHGEALDILSEHIESEYSLIVDCDIAFLCKDWDKIVIEKMQDNIVVVGSEYDPFQKRGPYKYKNFPNVVTCLIKSNVIAENNISFKPNDKNRILNIDETNSDIYQNPAGCQVDLDTGWEMCYKLKSNGYSGISTDMRRKSAGHDCLFLQEGTGGEEHQLDGKVLWSHAGRSFTRDFNTHPKALNWRKNVEWWFTNKHFIQ